MASGMGRPERGDGRMKKIGYVKKAALDFALQHEYRQYLSGHLMREQPFLQHVENDVEVGVSQYREFTADRPHVHPTAIEHGYILQGSVKVRLLDGSNEEYQFNEGDFFVIHPGIGYASKNAINTKVLFIKAPAGNDKVLLPVDAETQVWLMAWD